MVAEPINTTSSLPSQGAWIEIGRTTAPSPEIRPSLPSRGAWIEILWGGVGNEKQSAQSLPSRGAWIEIGGEPVIVSGREVAPLTGSVD